MNSTEITEALKERWQLASDNQLAQYLDVSRQVIYQFKRKKQEDIQSKIIEKLLQESSEAPESAAQKEGKTID